MLKPIFITATSLSDAWFQALYKCVDQGRNFTIDQGSFEGQDRREFDFFTVHITHPDKGELLPQLPEGSLIPNPVEEGYLTTYLPYLMTGEEKEGEAYTYGQRICKSELLTRTKDFEAFKKWLPLSIFNEKTGIHYAQDQFTEISADNNAPYKKWLNQMELMIWTYKNKGHRNNQMIMQIGQPSDMALKDPPCLRHIDTRIQDGKLHFMPYFRSWDLFGGFPANLAAIELMKQYCADEIGVGNGEIIASSKGLHIYDYVFEIAEVIRGKSIEEFRDNQI